MKFPILKTALCALLFAGALGATSTARAQYLSEPFQLVNYVTGYCMGVNANSTTPGALIITWQCNGTVSQIWFQGEPTPPASILGFPVYTLTSDLLDCQQGCTHLTSAASPGQGALVKTQLPGPIGGATDYQGWAMVPITTQNGNLCYEILNGGTTGQNPYNLGVQDANRAEGTPIVTWQDNDTVLANHPDQIWCVVSEL